MTVVAASAIALNTIMVLLGYIFYSRSLVLRQAFMPQYSIIERFVLALGFGASWWLALAAIESQIVTKDFYSSQDVIIMIEWICLLVIGAAVFISLRSKPRGDMLLGAVAGISIVANAQSSFRFSHISVAFVVLLVGVDLASLICIFMGIVNFARTVR